MSCFQDLGVFPFTITLINLHRSILMNKFISKPLVKHLIFNNIRVIKCRLRIPQFYGSHRIWVKLCNHKLQTLDISNLKYLSFMPLGFKDVRIRKFKKKHDDKLDKDTDTDKSKEI